MTAAQELELSWDDLAAMWRLDGGPAGPAGASVVELGAALWRFDRLDAGRIVEAYVPAERDDRRSPVARAGLDAVAEMCGDGVSAALREMSDHPHDRPRRVACAVGTAQRRVIAARLGVILDAADASPAPTWWTVEAAWVGGTLGAVDADDLAGEAFEAVDGLPDGFFAAVASHHLAAPIAAVLSRVGLAEHELPKSLQLAPAELDRRFEDMVDRFRDEPVRAELQRGVPAFRADDGTWSSEEMRQVDWIDVRGDVLQRATWSVAEGGRVEVMATATGATPGTVARLVDLSGRVPVVVDVAPLVPTGTRSGVTTLVATLRGPSTASAADHRVELVVDDRAAPLDDDGRDRRHAVSVAAAAATLERIADADARFRPSSAPAATRRAADRWADAAEAWEPHDAQHADACRRRAARLGERFEGTGAAAPSVEPPEDLAVAGWAEAVGSVARWYLLDQSEVPLEPRAAHTAAGLALLAETLDDVESAARFRVEQARAMVDGTAKVVTARIALSHFAAMGATGPLDIGGLGARDG